MMAMAEFEIQSGSKILLNTNAISSVMEFRKNFCKIFMIGEDESPWYVKGTFKEIEDKIWKADRGEGVF